MPPTTAGYENLVKADRRRLDQFSIAGYEKVDSFANFAQTAAN